MTEKMAIRTFPTAFKLKAIKRAEGGEGVLPAARKLESFVQMKFEGGAEPDFKFPRASAYPGQSVLNFLDELSRGLPSKGSGIGFTSNINGDFVVVLGPLGGADTIVEGQNALILRETIYNVAQSGAVPAVGQRPGNNETWGAKVASVPFFNETIETFGKPFTPAVVVNEIPAWTKDVLKGRAGNTGRWSQSDQITVTATVQGWIRPSGGLWLRGQTVNVTSPMLIMESDPLIANDYIYSGQRDWHANHFGIV